MIDAAHNTQESPLQRYLRNQALYYNGGNLGRVSLQEAAHVSSGRPERVLVELIELRKSGFLQALKIGGGDGRQVFYRVAV